MKDLQWFLPIPEARPASARSAAWPAVGMAVIGGLLLSRGYRTLAMVIWAATILFALALISPFLRSNILRATHWLGGMLGRVVTLAVLWPFYVLVFGGIHLVLAVSRTDLLGFRFPSGQPSYWQPAASEQKRRRHYQHLYTVETARRESHAAALCTATFAIILVFAVGSEIVLRLMGFGNPILYRVDPRIGYYPAPHQDVHRYGGSIHINGFGMRSREVASLKPAGTFRILMLGDSTLYAGSYIDQTQMYATRLERLLNQQRMALPALPRQVEILCVGVNGWGPQHELAYVKEFGLFQADLVMVMGPPADAYRSLHGIEQMPFFVEGHRPRFAWQEFGEHLLWMGNLRMTGAGADFDTGPQAREVLADGVAAWLAIAARARAEGGRVDFEFLPNEEEARTGKASPSTQAVLDALLPDLEKGQSPFSYPLTHFERALRGPKVYHDGAHLDVAGHEMYATYLRYRVLEVVPAK